MPTLIIVYNSKGVVGRCDASCHNAVMSRCRCVCGGINHGIGLDQARTNTKRITDEQIREGCESSARGGTLKIVKEHRQLEFFDRK